MFKVQFVKYDEQGNPLHLRQSTYLSRVPVIGELVSLYNECYKVAGVEQIAHVKCKIPGRRGRRTPNQPVAFVAVSRVE